MLPSPFFVSSKGSHISGLPLKLLLIIRLKVLKFLPLMCSDLLGNIFCRFAVQELFQILNNGDEIFLNTGIKDDLMGISAVQC